MLVQYQPFQFYSLLCCNGEAISTRFRRRTSHSKIATNDESYFKGAVARIILDFSKPGEETLRKSRSIAEKEERSGRPDIGIDRLKDSDYYYCEQFIESFSSSKLLKVG